jgi:hypothetical protein
LCTPLVPGLGLTALLPPCLSHTICTHTDAAGKASKASKGLPAKAKALPAKADAATQGALKKAKALPAKAEGAAEDAVGKVKRASSDLQGSLPAGNARLSRPLVRDSLGQLRPQAVNGTGAAGGNQRGAKMAVKKAVNEAVEQVSAN